MVEKDELLGRLRGRDLRNVCVRSKRNANLAFTFWLGEPHGWCAQAPSFSGGAVLGLIPSLAARWPACSWRGADLLRGTIRDVAACTADLDALHAAVGPKADALETRGAGARDAFAREAQAAVVGRVAARGRFDALVLPEFDRHAVVLGRAIVDGCARVAGRTDAACIVCA